ncbi:hypothetical protein KY290_024912 [Solanum tuberosum]|uniref:Retrovirus-related Pol polyprotein from transposon TNT 1-94-like beta-barrel domain-containing protein n=1 Tax=Solanum tuberosum TaxID=4113 RepID=A0ABQ7UU16_SOLTU|nr:hypothetical protein KY284_023767 [Solanum tuberosum]KAH0754642.1 hypothetical protein KY290_024912 [Solanum tuberosum]
MVVPATTSDTAAAVPTTTHVVQFNPAAQLPIKMQGNLNFATWKAQLVMLLNGHKLLRHLTGAKSAPSTIITQTDMRSVENLIKASKTVATYLQEIRSINDALKVAGSPVGDDKLAVKILSGLGHKYREITAAIRAHDTVLIAQRTNFQSQHQKNNRRFSNQSSKPQVPRQAYPGNQQNGRQPRQAVKCQLCQKIGHTTNVCRSKSHNHFEAKVNFVSNHHPDTNPWILDSGATHHVTADSDNLKKYTGNEEVSMGDGKTIPITHTGLTQIKASNSNFMLSNTLCAPAIKKNLISVAKFCTDNLTSIEFFPHSFLVKDLKTRSILVQGWNKHGLYEWPRGIIFHLPPTSPPPKSPVNCGTVAWVILI